ncbi:MAG: TIGR03936 family radical SAM-associated protein [Lachnospiraceae bacterium]|nr:TIGR03936 family radical SAM-associated protein [Lachnospiraceae bacterium]
MKIRLKFSKDGVMKYIGHLDVMRYFQKLIRRADIPIAYSTGMSPHQIMSFAMPLGIGLESDAEYVDIEITEPISSKVAINRLNDESVEGIRVKSFKLLPDNARNAMASIFAAEYEVGFLEGYEPDFSCFDILNEMYNEPCINVLKKTKKSESVVDIKPGIFSFSDSGKGIRMCLSCGSVLNVKPESVITSIYEHMGQKADELTLAIRRKEIYTGSQNELISLDMIGTDIE